MPLEGLMQMYVQDSALFWQVIKAIAPGFVVGVLYGLLVHSRQLNGGSTSGWHMLRFCLTTNIVSLLWVGHLTHWPILDTTATDSSIVVGLCALLLMLPITGGVLTGMRLMQGYWFIKQMIYQLRFYFRI